MLELDPRCKEAPMKLLRCRLLQLTVRNCSDGTLVHRRASEPNIISTSGLFFADHRRWVWTKSGAKACWRSSPPCRQPWPPPSTVVRGRPQRHDSPQWGIAGGGVILTRCHFFLHSENMRAHVSVEGTQQVNKAKLKLWNCNIETVMIIQHC